MNIDDCFVVEKLDEFLDFKLDGKNNCYFLPNSSNEYYSYIKEFALKNKKKEDTVVGYFLSNKNKIIENFFKENIILPLDSNSPYFDSIQFKWTIQELFWDDFCNAINVIKNKDDIADSFSDEPEDLDFLRIYNYLKRNVNINKFYFEAGLEINYDKLEINESLNYYTGNDIPPEDWYDINKFKKFLTPSNNKIKKLKGLKVNELESLLMNIPSPDDFNLITTEDVINYISSKNNGNGYLDFFLRNDSLNSEENFEKLTIQNSKKTTRHLYSFDEIYFSCLRKDLVNNLEYNCDITMKSDKKIRVSPNYMEFNELSVNVSLYIELKDNKVNIYDKDNLMMYLNKTTSYNIYEIIKSILDIKTVKYLNENSLLENCIYSEFKKIENNLEVQKRKISINNYQEKKFDLAILFENVEVVNMKNYQLNNKADFKKVEKELSINIEKEVINKSINSILNNNNNNKVSINKKRI